MVSTVEVPDRGLFTSAILPPHSLNLPPISLRRVRTRLYFMLFCYQNVETPTSTAPGLAPSEGCIFCLCAWLVYFL